jgi:hypothetical protein
VHELIAQRTGSRRALWRMFGGFASVAGTVRLRTSGADPARLVLPAAPWRPVRQWPYGLRLLDVTGAFPARGIAPLDMTLPFRVTGDGLDGSYRSRPPAAPSPASWPRRRPGVHRPRPRPAAYAGVQSCANLRFAGLLERPGPRRRAVEALLGGRPFHIRNYY